MFRSIVAVVGRVFLSTIFFMAAAGNKIPHFSQVAQVMANVGVPAPHLMAWLTIGTEILGGTAILLGAFVWLVSVPTVILLVVAIVTVHLPYGFSSIKLVSIAAGHAQFGPPGYECDLLYIACIVALVLSRPSPWSIDAYRLRKGRTAFGLSGFYE